MIKAGVILALFAAAAHAFTLGAGAFYAASYPAGGAANRYGPEFTGFGGKVAFGVAPAFDVVVGFGYHGKYKGDWEDLAKTIVPEGSPPGTENYPAPEDVDDYYLTTIPITVGLSYPLSSGPVAGYLVGGGGLVMERFSVGGSWTAPWRGKNPPEGYGQEEPQDVNKPAVFIGAGFTYAFAERLAFDLNPRWIMVLDSVADDPATAGIDEGVPNSMFVDLLIGLNYSFI